MAASHAVVHLLGRRSERATLDAFVAAVRAGESQAPVVRGEPGVGKSALLDYVAEQATGCRKLGITSRRAPRSALPDGGAAVVHA